MVRRANPPSPAGHSGVDGADPLVFGRVTPELHGTATVAVPTTPVFVAVAVIVAVPQLVVLAVNFVEMKPGVTPLVGFTDDPGTPDTVKSTVSPLSSLPLARVAWKVYVQAHALVHARAALRIPRWPRAPLHRRREGPQVAIAKEAP
jgi:hypothetical protein